MTRLRHEASTATHAAMPRRARTGRANGHRRTSERTAERGGRGKPVRSVGGEVCAVSDITRERKATH
ncbi:hypothetical protein San01_31910 [Streptomyces angustmyceticus]|uniref:Uncharacterized protein n=1 Tax=Streptomyces angustmyceticus TaxID=285578 RepID=A0A5J4LDX7_9ACTN|nr:hypothetical protein San01_31910 [Streptomyces angustmyceticus]